MTTITPGFRIAHAGGGGAGWEALVDSCLSQLGAAQDASLGFVYVTDILGESIEPILARLKDATGVADWTGTVGFGVCVGGREYFDTAAIAVLVCALPADSHRLLPLIREPGEPLPAEIAQWVASRRPMLGVVHGDPRNPYLADIIHALCDDIDCFLVGGLSASRGRSFQIAGDIHEGGLSGVLLAGDVAATTGLSQGCSPIGEVHEVTDARDNVVFKLDGRPALDVFKEDIGEVLARNLERVGGYIHAALPIAGSDSADYLVRNVMGIDPHNGWLSIGDRLSPGDRLMFVRRDGPSAFIDLQRMLGDVARRAGDSPRAGLYFSCVARGPNLFGRKSEELTEVAEKIGRDVPLVGFFANGEISNNRLYGYTGVLTLLG